MVICYWKKPMRLGVDYTEADVKRFMSYVDKLPNGCWFWTGARSRGKGNKKWYGSFRLGKRTIRAHKFACDALGECKEPLPPGWHRTALPWPVETCPEPPCCRSR